MMKRASFFIRVGSLLLCAAVLATLTPAALAATSIPISSLDGKKVSDVIRADGSLTGRFSASDKLPKGDDMFAFSSYAQLFEVLYQQQRISFPALPKGVSTVYDKSAIMPANPPKAAATGADAFADGSTTNVRTQGADEPDIIKTDGKSIYYLSRDSSDGKRNLFIVQAQTMKVLATIRCPAASTFRNLLLSGDRLVIEAVFRPGGPSFGNRWFTTYYVYDIADRAKPTLVRTVRLSGYAHDARLLNNTLYAVTHNYFYNIDHDDALTKVLPIAYDSAVSKDYFALPPQAIHYFPDKAIDSFTALTAFRLDSNMPADFQVEACDPECLYMSANALYSTHINWSADNSTRIVRYSLQDAKFIHSGNATVPGMILNHYAIDEYKGFLRIATTNYSGIHMFVLDTSLNQAGAATDLISSKRIQSVRFMGDAGYVDTYLRSDPLFALDLSDPVKPRFMGQLKVPGFSAYLHPFGSKYLVGIGRETVETYSTQNGKRVPTGDVEDIGLKISLFDVSRPTSPREVAKKVIGGPNTDTDAMYEPRAIMVDESRSLMAFPIDYDDNDPFGNAGDKSSAERWTGGIVLTITPGGIIIKAKMKRDDLLETEGFRFYYYANDSRFSRIGNTIYYAMGNAVRSYDYTTFKPIAQVQLK